MKRALLFGLTVFILWATHTQSQDLSDSELKTVFDSLVSQHMEKHHVPGAGYALVKGQEVVHMSTQGLSNLTTEEVVKIETRFMLGSIAKLFTTIGVLQLYEKKQVDLDEDINSYIKSFQLPYKVTLRQLLTHTGGLEESVFERIKLSANELLPLEKYLAQKAPPQFIAPGKYPAYSNHGMALAGLVIQEQTGIRFEEYAQQMIFEPLGMTQSSFELDEASRQHLATSYKLTNDQPKEAALEYVQTTPASMLISSNDDMSKFMHYLLNPQSSSILEPETLQLMLSTQYTPHERLWGRAFGFFERHYHGIPLLEHGGSRLGFYGQLTIAPRDSLGIFIIGNGGSSRFRTDVTFDLLSALYPKKVFNRNFQVGTINAADYTGTYLSNRRMDSGFGKLILQQTFVEKIKVSEIDTNTIGLLGREFKAESKDQFEISSDSTASLPIAFGRNDKGEINTLFFPGRSDSLKKMKWHEHAEIGLVTFGMAFLVFMILSVVGLIKLGSESQMRTLMNYRLIHSISNTAFLIMLTGTLIVFGEDLQYEIPAIFYFICSLPFIGLLSGFFFGCQLATTWSGLATNERLTNAVISAFSILYFWQLYYWNLLGFQF